MSRVATRQDQVGEEETKGSSDRTFGLVMAAFFLVTGVGRHLDFPRPWAFWVCGWFVLIAVARPSLLHPLNIAWTKLGELLGKVVNPVVMAILFYLVMTPAAILMRLFGQDPLRLKTQPGASSYWLPREPAGPPPETMANQF